MHWTFNPLFLILPHMTKPLAKRLTTKPKEKKRRYSPRVRRAIEAMVWEGLDHKTAAEQANLNPEAFRRSLQRPHYIQLLRQEHARLREAAPFKAYSRIERLAEQANSEPVKLEANKWIAGVDALAPVSRVDINARVAHSFVNYDYSDALDITPAQGGSNASDAEIVDDDDS